LAVVTTTAVIFFKCKQNFLLLLQQTGDRTEEGGNNQPVDKLDKANDVLLIINSSSNKNRQEQATVLDLVHWITFTMVMPPWLQQWQGEHVLKSQLQPW